MPAAKTKPNNMAVLVAAGLALTAALAIPARSEPSRTQTPETAKQFDNNSARDLSTARPQQQQTDRATGRARTTAPKANRPPQTAAVSTSTATKTEAETETADTPKPTTTSDRSFAPPDMLVDEPRSRQPSRPSTKNREPETALNAPAPTSRDTNPEKKPAQPQTGKRRGANGQPAQGPDTPNATKTARPIWAGRYVDAPAAGASATFEQTPADPVAAAVVARLDSEDAKHLRFGKKDLAALRAHYKTRTATPLWVTKTGLTANAIAIVKEIRNADDWGLRAADFALPANVAPGASTDEKARAELQISASVLKYVRHARGGRIPNPRRLSRLLDQTPQVLDPTVVLKQVANTDSPAAYLRDQHPTYPQFQRLRLALLKLRGKTPDGKKQKTAAATTAQTPKKPKVIIPAGPTLKLGISHPNVALLRSRLEISAAPNDKKFDRQVQLALKRFQAENGLSADGVMGPATRAVLNGNRKAARKHTGSNKARIQKIILNMERWRWMPREPGSFYIFNNIPEFTTRVFDNGRQVYREKIIVGKPKNPTPAFSADMQLVVFHPSWGVPNGIKKTEILPYLQRKTGLFGLGGYDTRILRQHNLTVTKNGRPVDASKVNWGKVDIRQYHFTQAPGKTNVLGKVKFRFPNRHDVYMHDTPERHLFAQSHRALSHGCMRVKQPRRLAEIILAHDQGWSKEKVGRSWAGGGQRSVSLKKPIPVHTGYFTAAADENGNLRTFGDLYGHDRRVARALGSKPLHLAADKPARSHGAGTQRQKKKKKKPASGHPGSVADIFQSVFSP